jgi:serine/threonine-protein kinase
MHLRKQGDTEGAAHVLENAGMHAESVELRLGESAGKSKAAGAAADLLEKAGDHRAAGEAFERQGDLAGAARNYEQAYDYQRAADCYSELGDSEKVIGMLEALGDVYEAGKYAAGAGQADRAIHNLQQVDARHGFYSEASRLLAELLTERGEIDLAVEKYAEALEIWGESAPLDMQQSYAELLEKAERQQEALTVYEGIRRRDVHFGDVASRIEVLKKQISTVIQVDPGDSATTPVAKVSRGEIGDAESRYEILEELGRGAMGVVFRARDRNLGRVVALKVLTDSLRQHPQAVKLFLREARAAAALNHQNIVTLFDAGQEGDTYFLTMECLEGAGLETVLASRGTLPTKAVATVGLQVAAGLDYAQRAKIVHRDIKPSNLFLTRDRTVKVMDFGLAKMVEEVRRGSTVIGGTPNFMAPEQAQGGRVDHRTDLYALGGTLFELVTGTVPFESGDVVYHHIHTPPPDARERNVDVPEAMAELLMQMMAKDPDARVQSARELAGRLQAILKGA